MPENVWNFIQSIGSWSRAEESKRPSKQQRKKECSTLPNGSLWCILGVCLCGVRVQYNVKVRAKNQTFSHGSKTVADKRIDFLYVPGRTTKSIVCTVFGARWKSLDRSVCVVDVADIP